MKLLVLLGFIFSIQAFAALPVGVSRHAVPGHADITLYEVAAGQNVPSFWQSFFALFHIQNSAGMDLPFQRSVAVLVGIGHYHFMTPKLEYVSRDVEKIRDYLLGDGGFDAVYVLDERVSPETVTTFMSDELPQKMRPNDRLLFYYSGHGADSGSGHPVLLFQQARPGEWGKNILRVDEYEQWSVLKIKHLLFIYDACMAGEATIAKGADVGTAVSELSGNGSRIVVTAGTAKQQAWVVKESSESQYSLFTEALLRVLIDGTAESKTRGFITINQAVVDAEVLLAVMTRHLGPNHEMNPDLVKIDPTRTGTFVFINPHAVHPSIPQADILAMGIGAAKGSDNSEINQARELAYWNSIDSLNDAQLYTRLCNEFPDGLFCPIARRRLDKLALKSKAPATPDLTTLDVAGLRTLAGAGSQEAISQLGKTYEFGLQGAPVDLPISIQYFKRAADLGDGDASFRLGQIYHFGNKGVPKDDAEAAFWFRRAAEGGNVFAMESLGLLFANGLGGLPKDGKQAARWYQQAADAGDARAMVNLGTMYVNGLGGLPKDEMQALSWFRKAVAAEDGLGMANLGFMYENGLGGLPKDETQAVVWYQKSAEAGNSTGMANLGVMYRNGLGGLPKDEAQAINWYRKAAQAGSLEAKAALARLGDSILSPH